MYGAARGDELTNVHVKDVRTEGGVFVIDFPKTKTNVGRMFTVDREYASYLREYMKLRPANVPHTRFFINYQKGQCTTQPIGRNKFLGTPKLIAEFLNLEQPGDYTGHSFRRTSATVASNAGVSFSALKELGGWRSPKVVEGYVEKSVERKKRTAALITAQISSGDNDSETISKKNKIVVESTEENNTKAPTASTSSVTMLSQSTTFNVMTKEIPDTATFEKWLGGIKVDNCKKVTINFNLNPKN